MIFRMITIYKNIKEGKQDPTGFGRDQLLDIIKGFIIPFLIIGFIILILFGLLGYSDLLGVGPFGFFKFVFIIGLIVFLAWLFVIKIIFSSLKSILNKAKSRVDAHVFHHDITPK